MLGRLFGFNNVPDQQPADQRDQPSHEPPYDSSLSEQSALQENSPAYLKGRSSLTHISLASASSSLFITNVKSDGALNQAIMYTTCDADVRSTAESHHFELVITRTDDDADDTIHPPQVVFPIDNSAAFESSDSGLGWSDDHGRRYHLDFDDETAARDFCATLARSLFETIHSRSPGPSDIESVRALLTKPEPAKPSDLLAAAGELIRVGGELFKYDVEVEKFDLLAPKIILTINSAVVKEDNTRAYLMAVYNQDGCKKLMETELNNSMTGQFFTETLSVVWILNLDPDAEPEFEEGKLDPEKQVCLSVKIPDPVAFVRFREQYAVCLYEVNHQASMDDLKLKNEDRDYIANVERDDVDPMEIDDDDDTTDVEYERNVRDEMPGGRASIADVDDGMVNGQLAVSANTDRSFVVRGNKMGVFRTGVDGAAFTTAIDFTDPSKDGKRFMPSNILLHEGDTSMLILDSQDDSKLMRMDLERGKIVDTWSGPVMKHNTVNNVHRASKYANLTDTKEFVGLNKNALMRMDPRTREFVVQSKRYAAGTRAKLDCMATTGTGHLAVASENGDIRLYDQIGKNAKTHLPGLGDRITGIDVSEDGNYILATTAKYLLVINSIVKGEKTYSGFAKSMGKNKPIPRKLVIKPEDIVKHRMGEVCFTPAHFNTGRSSLERSIVTSTGPFLITWNFRAVKLGRLNSYNVTRFRDNIVADDFAFGDEGRIVMSLPNDVSVVARR